MNSLVAGLSWLWGRLALTVAHSLEVQHPDLALRLCRAVASHNRGATRLRLQRLHAEAAVNEGRVLGDAGAEQSLALNNEIITTYQHSIDPDLRNNVAWATVNKGWDLLTLGNAEGAADLYQDLDGRLPRETSYGYLIGNTLINWALVLDRLGRHSAEIEIYDRIQRELPPLGDASSRYWVLWASIDKGISLADDQQQYQAAIVQYQIVLDDLNSSAIQDSETMECLASTLRNRAHAFAAMGQYETAIEGVNEALKRCHRSRDPGVQEELAWAMLTKGGAHEALGNGAVALHVYNTLVAEFAKSRSAAAREAVMAATNRRDALLSQRRAIETPER